MTTTYPSVVNGWHYHKKQTDNFICVHSMIKVALYNGKDDSKTNGNIMKLIVGMKNSILINVHPGVYYGFKGIRTEIAYFLSTGFHRTSMRYHSIWDWIPA